MGGDEDKIYTYKRIAWMEWTNFFLHISTSMASSRKKIKISRRRVTRHWLSFKACFILQLGIICAPSPSVLLDHAVNPRYFVPLLFIGV